MFLRSRGTALFTLLTFLWQTVGRAEEKSAEPLPSVAIAGFRSQQSPTELDIRTFLSQQLQDSKRVALIPDGVTAQSAQALWRSDQKESSALLDRAQKRYREGRELYEKLALDEAIAALDDAVNSYRKGISALRENRFLLASHLYLGMALLIRGDADKGREFIRQMIILDPTRKNHPLSPREFPPKIVALHAQLTKQVLSKSLGQIILRSKPSGATVYFDGVEQPPTPIEMKEIPVGEHFILIEKRGYQPHAERIDIQAGVNNVNVELQEWKALAPYPFERRLDISATDLLTQMGKETGAQILVLGTINPLKENVVTLRAQLFDTRSREFSKIVSVDIPENKTKKGSESLVGLLLAQITTGGLVVPQINMTERTGSTPLASDQHGSPLPPSSSKPLYKEWWLWAIVGGAVAVGVGSYFISSSGSDSNVLVIQTP